MIGVILPCRTIKLSTEPIDSLTLKILKRYNKRPIGWSVLQDFKGNMLIIGPREGYMLKMITINPQEYTGVGIKIENPKNIKKLVKGAPSYGYRPLPNAQAKSLLNSFDNNEKQRKIILEILKRKPVPTWEINRKKTKSIIKWPYLGSS